MLVTSTCFADSLLTPLFTLRVSVPYVQKRMVSPMGHFHPPHKQSKASTQTGRSYVPDNSRILLPAEALAAIEKFRKVKSEPMEAIQIPVAPRADPRKYIQRHNEQGRDIEPVVYRLGYGTVRTPTYVEPTIPTITWEQVIGLSLDAYAQHGVGCSETTYQSTIFWKLYALGVAAVRERTLIVEEDGFTVSRGRTDLEIASKFLLEFKICPPTSENVRKARVQVKRYLRTYAEKGQPMQRAAIIFFGSFNEMRVVEVSLGETKRYSPY